MTYLMAWQRIKMRSPVCSLGQSGMGRISTASSWNTAAETMQHETEEFLCLKELEKDSQLFTNQQEFKLKLQNGEYQ